MLGDCDPTAHRSPQVIVDADADTASSVCGRCGALVKRSRMDAHATTWCEALLPGEALQAGEELQADEQEADELHQELNQEAMQVGEEQGRQAVERSGSAGLAGLSGLAGLACAEPDVKTPASHLSWARSTTVPQGTVPPKRIDDGSAATTGVLV